MNSRGIAGKDGILAALGRSRANPGRPWMPMDAVSALPRLLPGSPLSFGRRAGQRQSCGAGRQEEGGRKEEKEGRKDGRSIRPGGQVCRFQQAVPGNRGGRTYPGASRGRVHRLPGVREPLPVRGGRCGPDGENRGIVRVKRKLHNVKKPGKQNPRFYHSAAAPVSILSD